MLVVGKDSIKHGLHPHSNGSSTAVAWFQSMNILHAMLLCMLLVVTAQTCTATGGLKHALWHALSCVVLCIPAYGVREGNKLTAKWTKDVRRG